MICSGGDLGVVGDRGTEGVEDEGRCYKGSFSSWFFFYCLFFLQGWSKGFCFANGSLIGIFDNSVELRRTLNKFIPFISFRAEGYYQGKRLFMFFTSTYFSRCYEEIYALAVHLFEFISFSYSFSPFLFNPPSG